MVADTSQIPKIFNFALEITMICRKTTYVWQNNNNGLELKYERKGGSMVKVILSTNLKELNGSDTKVNGKSITLGEAAGNVLSSSAAKQSSIKQYDLALKLYQTKGMMELEDAEVELIEEMLKIGKVSTLAAGQILKALGVKK